MRKFSTKLSIFVLIFILINACQPCCDSDQSSNRVPSEALFDISVEAMPNENAPDLQSYVHAQYGDEWLLFAGRTNQDKDNGGLHNMNANYSNTSFPPPSFNEHIYVYNVVSDQKDSISLTDFKEVLTQNFPESAKAMKGYESVFKNSNPVVNQEGEYLYVIGGYGAKDFDAGPTGIQDYITYNHVARLNIKDMINLVKGNYAAINKDYLMAFTRDTTNTLLSTGGELMISGSSAAQNLTFYMTGGHCFGNNCATGQKYVDASYPFSLDIDTLNNAKNYHKLVISMSHAISDVSDPKGVAADNLSAMRRRDGPIIPQLYKSPVSGNVQQGFAFFSGVFKAGQDSDLQAWNDAIYFHPNWSNKENALFTYDREYNQKNYNVYAAPSFAVYDPSSEKTNSYILGGIGDGKPAPNGFLSGFTNTGMRIETNTVTDFNSDIVITSSNEIFSENVYGSSDKNEPNFYGAEAIFFLKDDSLVYEISNGKNTPATKTELIDYSKIKENEVVIGYVYGGIEAFVSNPASYGPRKSRASKKVFKVILTKR